VSPAGERIARPFTAAWRVVESAVFAGYLPSAVFAVADEHETLATRQLGPTGEEGAVRADSIFLLASVTKPIVATGILQLVERGDLLLHEPVANNWPEFAMNGKAYFERQLSKAEKLQ